MIFDRIHKAAPGPLCGITNVGEVCVSPMDLHYIVQMASLMTFGQACLMLGRLFTVGIIVIQESEARRSVSYGDVEWL